MSDNRVTVVKSEFSQNVIDTETGELKELTHSSYKIFKSKLQKKDQYIKVSKYLNVIFAFFKIPLNLVPFSLLVAQYMDFKTNTVYLLKDTKIEMMQMLGMTLKKRKKDGVETEVYSTSSIDRLIKQCVDYNILKRTNTKGRYEVNSYLFSTGTLAETKELQAHFDFNNDTALTYIEQSNKMTGETIEKAILNSNKVKGHQYTIDEYLEELGKEKELKLKSGEILGLPSSEEADKE